MFTRRAFIAAGSAGLLLPQPAIAEDGGAPIVSRIVVEDERVWVAATIGGGKPLLFIVDTGAALNLMRPEVAAGVAKIVAGRQNERGIGKHEVAGEVIGVRDLAFGNGIRLPVADFGLYDFGNGFAADAAGLLCSGLVTTRDSELDFEAGEWRIWPRGRSDWSGLDALSSTIEGPDDPRSTRRMFADVAVDGMMYRLLLDTGAPHGLTLFARASRRTGLFRDDVPFAPAVTSGIGGATAKLSRLVRAQSVQFGPISIGRPIISLFDPDQSQVGDHDGILGLGYLQLLTVATDIHRRRVLVRRNNRQPLKQTYRASGLWLDRTAGGSATVASVGTGSPAANAGVRQGDAIVDPPRFEDAVGAITGPLGKAVTIATRRDGGATETRHFTLAAYL